MAEAREIRDRWERSAPRWREQGELVRRLTAPATGALLEVAGPRPGERWVDIAGGIGDPAVMIAGRVGPSGAVVVLDLVEGMAEAAGRALATSAAPGLSVVAAAEAMPAAGAFDGATCRFGAMFFADPERALAEIRTALAPGGRGVFVVWSQPERNPMFGELNAAIRAALPETPEPGPDDPHVHRYAESGRLADALRRTGWERVEERAIGFTMTAPLGADQLWDHLVRLSDELARLVGEADDDLGARLRADYLDRIAGYEVDGAMAFPAEILVVAGRAPGQRGA